MTRVDGLAGMGALVGEAGLTGEADLAGLSEAGDLAEEAGTLEDTGVLLRLYWGGTGILAGLDGGAALGFVSPFNLGDVLRAFVIWYLR